MSCLEGAQLIISKEINITKEDKMNRGFYLSRVFIIFIMVAFASSISMTQEESPAEYIVKDFSHLLGMSGFSDTLLKNHFKLYQGYVKNTNLLLDKLAALLKEGKELTPEYAELKRRFGFEFNGMRLHEYYFGNLGGKRELDKENALYKRTVKDFASFDAWKKDFISTGSMRGIGWVVLYQDPKSGHLINSWINEHEVNHLAGCQPILVMDVFEHAYLTDYQLNRAQYMEAFFKNINWEKVAERFR